MNEQALKSLFAEVLGLPIERIGDDLRYDEVAEWDSIAHMALIAALDETFGLTIARDDISRMLSFAEAKTILAQNYGVRIEPDAANR